MLFAELVVANVVGCWVMIQVFHVYLYFFNDIEGDF